MQTCPDWSETHSPETFAKEFNMVFTGPGFYLTKTDTMLVTPNTPNGDEIKWSLDQPAGTVYRVDVYNVPFSSTIFASVDAIPRRSQPL